MSTSPIRQVFETAAPSDLVNIQRPTAGGFSAIDASVPLASMLESGNYTPTISGEVNLTAAPNFATYIRVGNVATVSIQLQILFSAGENSGLFEVELPVATTFTTQKQCFGLLQYSFAGTESELAGLTIGANTTNNTCQVEIEVVTDELAMSYATLQFQYEIV